MAARNDGPFGEAIMTDSKLSLYLAVGDCYPIILVDTGGEHRRIALIHGGRESTVRSIAAKTVRAMQSVYGTDPANLIVGFGPGIRQDSYKIEHFAASANDPRWGARGFVREIDGGVLLDLLGYNIMLLTEEAKVPRENIFVAPYDTYRAMTPKGIPMFSSHRRAKDTGEPESRFGVVVRLVQ
jgi:copper oxidase (laccase) domain-containing protein